MRCRHKKGRGRPGWPPSRVDNSFACPSSVERLSTQISKAYSVCANSEIDRGGDGVAIEHACYRSGHINTGRNGAASVVGAHVLVWRYRRGKQTATGRGPGSRGWEG